MTKSLHLKCIKDYPPENEELIWLINKDKNAEGTNVEYSWAEIDEIGLTGNSVEYAGEHELKDHVLIYLDDEGFVISPDAVYFSNDQLASLLCGLDYYK